MENKSKTIFNRIWNPTQDELLSVRMFFKVFCMAFLLFSAIFTKIFPNGQILLFLFICLIFAAIIRITVGIRSGIVQTKPIGGTDNSFLESLPKNKRKKFLVFTFIYMPIGLIMGLPAGLFIVHLMQKSQGETLTLDVVLVACLPVLLIAAYTVWKYYRLLRSGRESSFD